MTPLYLAILALATYRLAHLISLEDGPSKVCRRLRLFAGAYQIMDGSWDSETFFGKLLSCFFCASVWIAALIYGEQVYLSALDFLWIILALSGAACLLQKATERQ